jgi:predicted histone-like DNA-binding protein
MKVKYHVTRKKNPSKPGDPGKFYIQIKTSGKTTMRKIAEQIAQFSSISRADCMAMLEALLMIIPQEVAEGRIVSLGDLGTFSLRVSSTGSDTEEKVTPHNIRSKSVMFRPGKLVKDALHGITFEKDTD